MLHLDFFEGGEGGGLWRDVSILPAVDSSEIHNFHKKFTHNEADTTVDKRTLGHGESKWVQR